MSTDLSRRSAPGQIRRRPIATGPAVTVESATDHNRPVVVSAAAAGIDLAIWLRDNRDRLRDLLHDRGAVVFQGFGVSGPEELERLVLAVSPEAMNYVYGSTPRSRELRQVYTSTEYPADQTIPQHNELAYARTWPMLLWFLSHKAAETGGATPIADSRRVYERIPAYVRDRFAEHGVMYIRNYGAGLDLSWQQTFETEDPAEVERFCDGSGIRYEWLADGRLRTSQVAQGVARHPVTGETCWFNQAHLFHTSSLPEDVRGALMSSVDPRDLPRNALYGDGTPIEDDVIALIHAAFEAETVAAPWSDGDVMLIDNVLVSHGRQPYTGARKVLVAMAEPNSADEAGAANG